MGSERINVVVRASMLLDSGFPRSLQPHDITKSFYILYMEVIVIGLHNSVIIDRVLLLLYPLGLGNIASGGRKYLSCSMCPRPSNNNNKNCVQLAVPTPHRGSKLELFLLLFFFLSIPAGLTAQYK